MDDSLIYEIEAQLNFNFLEEGSLQWCIIMAV
jgi:hypothetical protein